MAELMYTGDINKIASVTSDKSIIKPELQNDASGLEVKEESRTHGLCNSIFAMIRFSCIKPPNLYRQPSESSEGLKRQYSD